MLSPALHPVGSETPWVLCHALSVPSHCPLHHSTKAKGHSPCGTGCLEGLGSPQRVSAPHAALLKTSEEPQGSPLSSCTLPVLFSRRSSTFSQQWPGVTALLPFLTRLSSSFGRHLPSFASFFFSPHSGGAQLWPHSVSSPIWCFLAMCPRGAAAAVGHPPSPSCGAGPGTPPPESLRGAPTPCACPWGWDQSSQRGLATCGGPALPAASSRREAAKHRLWQHAAGRGTREGSEQSSSPAGFHFCQGLQRCFVPLC